MKVQSKFYNSQNLQFEFNLTYFLHPHHLLHQQSCSHLLVLKHKFYTEISKLGPEIQSSSACVLMGVVLYSMSANINKYVDNNSNNNECKQPL